MLHDVAADSESRNVVTVKFVELGIHITLEIKFAVLLNGNETHVLVLIVNTRQLDEFRVLLSLDDVHAFLFDRYDVWVQACLQPRPKDVLAVVYFE